MRIVIASLLTLALLVGAGVAVAQQADDAAAEPPAPEITDRDPRGLRSLADTLRQRERALDRRERTLDRQADDLAKARAEVESRLAELTATREAVEGLLAKLEDEEDGRLASLVKMVEGMRGKQAAPFVTELDDDLAVRVLDRMNPSKASKVLAAMAPKDAASLAEGLTRPLAIPETP